MSYNGIGLPTPRGSGTSGYIQKNTTANAANRAGMYERRRQNELEALRSKEEFSRTNVSDRRVDKDLLEHEQKRKIEAQCFELRDELEEEGKLSEEQIDEEVQKLRDKLTAESKKNKDGGDKGAAKGLKPHQIQELTAYKEKENERLRQAFDLGKRRGRRNSGGKPPAYVDYDSYRHRNGNNPTHNTQNVLSLLISNGLVFSGGWPPANPEPEVVSGNTPPDPQGLLRSILWVVFYSYCSMKPRRVIVVQESGPCNPNPEGFHRQLFMGFRIVLFNKNQNY
ncbi:hypothetical protein TRICI_005160 [Trichomonascus ciferrii]|uniref:Pre-mRNA-splicing factor CWC21 n=1 Tax=Trichomonascus ciferrii TaxID=44093 RepID=A0A642V0N1_9ASCO|nr:hypothetical protein TRICI_005160 [Trichomonascus ciferrii]